MLLALECLVTSCSKMHSTKLQENEQELFVLALRKFHREIMYNSFVCENDHYLMISAMMNIRTRFSGLDRRYLSTWIIATVLVDNHSFKHKASTSRAKNCQRQTEHTEKKQQKKNLNSC